MGFMQKVPFILKRTIKQYISHLEKIHIDFLHGVIQKQDLVQRFESRIVNDFD